MTAAAGMARLKRDQVAGNWAKVVDKVTGFTAWKGPVYAYRESSTECVLKPEAWPAPEPPPDAFEGRFFDQAAEVRWVRADHDEHGPWRVWLCGEDDADSEEEPFDYRDRKYYLVGLATGKAGEFSEARYPGKTFQYPVSECAKGCRAHILVREYRRRVPDWKKYQDAGAVRRLLDEALLVEHRFVSVAVETSGQGS